MFPVNGTDFAQFRKFSFKCAMLFHRFAKMSFFQKSIVLVQALLFLAKTMAIPIVMLQYTVNKEFIAKNLCDNRYKPELNCEGKCILMKKLEKHKETQENTEKGSIKLVVTEITHLSSTYQLKPAPLLLHFFSLYNPNGYSYNHHNDIFHPPLLVS